MANHVDWLLPPDLAKGIPLRFASLLSTKRDRSRL
jgi:hypothetical protein